MECKLLCGVRSASDITKPVFGIHTLCVCGFHQPQSQKFSEDVAFVWNQTVEEQLAQGLIAFSTVNGL